MLQLVIGEKGRVIGQYSMTLDDLGHGQVCAAG